MFIEARSVFTFLLVSGLLLFVLVNTSFAADASGVEKALIARHPSESDADLEKIAGGKDALIDELLKLRQKKSPPQLSVRAEKALLTYADEERVLAALESDMANAESKGLARTIALHLKKVKSPLARARLSSEARSRAGRDPSFTPMLREIESE